MSLIGTGRRRRHVAAGRRRRVHRRKRMTVAHLLRGVGRLMPVLRMSAQGRRRRHVARGRRRVHRRRGLGRAVVLMPVRHRAAGRRVRRRRGGNAFTDFFTKTIPGAAKTVYHKVLKPVGSFVKEHKLLSKGLSLIPHPAAQGAAKVAGAVGLGRRRRRIGRGYAGITRLTGYGRRRRHMGGSALSGRMYLN